jgi:hypothetical protein
MASYNAIISIIHLYHKVGIYQETAIIVCNKRATRSNAPVDMEREKDH